MLHQFGAGNNPSLVMRQIGQKAVFQAGEFHSTAYASALKYLGAGRALLTEETWDRNYPLIFSTEYLMAECELLTAEKVAAENRLSLLPQRAKNRHDFCVATRLRLTLYTTLDRCDRAVDVFLEWLRSDGTVWANRPTRDDVLGEYNESGLCSATGKLKI